MHWRLDNSSPGLCPLDANSTLPTKTGGGRMSQKDKIIFGDKGIWTPRPVFRSVCDAAAAPSYGAAQTGLEFSVSRRLADTVWPLGEEAPGKAATVPPGRMRGRPCPLGGSAYRLQPRVYTSCLIPTRVHRHRMGWAWVWQKAPCAWPEERQGQKGG